MPVQIVGWLYGGIDLMRSTGQLPVSELDVLDLLLTHRVLPEFIHHLVVQDTALRIAHGSTCVAGVEQSTKVTAIFEMSAEKNRSNRDPMLYQDEVYGKEEIREPLLLDILSSDAMQRAKGISQHGITALIGITPTFSRFDHSLGTMLLVRRLGADINEQVAALLHDISHTAFSHVVDYVFDDHNGQNYHEEQKEEFVANTDIPEVLERYGLDWRDFMDEEQFSLLEQPSPALCADRLDYFFRDLEFLKLATRDEIRSVLKALEVVEGQIAVTHSHAARWLAYTYIEADRASWSNFRKVGVYQVTAEAIKSAKRHGFIGKTDLWGSDEDLWRKLRSIDHPEVSHWVKRITPGTRFIWDDDQPVFRVSTKVRSIDPPVINGDSMIPLSALDPAFSQYRNDYLSSKKGLWPMEVVSSPEI